MIFYVYSIWHFNTNHHTTIPPLFPFNKLNVDFAKIIKIVGENCKNLKMGKRNYWIYFQWNVVTSSDYLVWLGSETCLSLTRLFYIFAEKLTCRKMMVQIVTVHGNVNCVQRNRIVLPILHPFTSIFAWLIYKSKALWILLWIICNTWLFPSLGKELSISGMCSFYICMNHDYILF